MEKINCAILIDDDDITLFVHENVLRKSNVTDDIRIAKNGSSGIKVLEDFSETHSNHCPELIFLDLNMPITNGFEFLDYFQTRDYVNKDKVKICLLTNSSQKKFIDEKVVPLNAYYLPKPLTLKSIQEILDKQR